MKEINTLSGGGASLSTPPNIGYINQMMYRMGPPPPFSSQQQKVLPDAKSVEIAVAMRPFTDSQQVQLRAQIIVYGALLKGLLPDEVLMVAAFADLNAGRQGADTVRVKKHEWEKPWYVAAERLKSSLATVSTAPLPFSIAKPSSAVVTTTIAADDRNLYSSPPGIRDILGSKGTSCQPMQNIGITTATNINTNTNTNKSMPPALSLPTQAMVLPSPLSDYSFSMKFSKSAQMDHSQMLKCSGINHGPFVTTAFPIQEWTPAVRNEALRPPFSTFHTIAGQDLTQQYVLPPSTNFTMPLPVQESTHVVLRDEQKQKSSHGHLLVSEPRSRKKMKSLIDLPVDINTKESSLTSTTPITRASVVSDAINVNTQGVSLCDAAISTSISPLPAFEVVDRVEKTSQSITVSDRIISDPVVSVVKDSLVSVVKETPLPVGKISDQLDQAKLSAEEAMLTAVSAVQHSEKIWNQFKSQKHSGLISGEEANPTSSFAITEAAALVAKAAAAAARLAYEAALQSSLAEEVSAPYNIQSIESASSGLAQNDSASGENPLLQLADSSARSTWQIPTNCKTIIDSAAEAAKKRLDFASAAKKRAENVIAIVRAAELAAAAVSHIQTVVALGDLASVRADKLSNSETAELPSNNTEKEMPIQSGMGDIGQNNGNIASPCVDCRKQDQPKEILSSGEACFQDAIKGAELPVEKANVPENLRQNEAKKTDRSQNVFNGIRMVDAVVTLKNARKSLVTSGLEIEECSAAETETPAPKRVKRDTRVNEKRLYTEESHPRENYTGLADEKGGRESKMSRMKIGVPKGTEKHTFLDVNKSQTFKKAEGRRIPEESEIATPSSPQSKPKTSKTTAKFASEAKPGQEDMFERIVSNDGKVNPSADFNNAQKSNAKRKKWNVVDQSQHEQHKLVQVSQDRHRFNAQISDSKRKEKKETRKRTASKNDIISAETRPSTETENKRDSGNISTEPRRRSSRVSQPTSKLLEGLETTPTLGRSLHLQ